MIEGEWHAFYSNEAINFEKSRRITSKGSVNNSTLTNIYRLKGSDKLVEVTCVFRVDEFPNAELHSYYKWEDKEYLGIVDAWVKVGEVI